MAFIKSVSILLMVQLPTMFAQFDGESEDPLFGNDIPQGYFARTDLSDCLARFHNRFQNEQCLIFGGVRVNSTEFPHMAVIGWLNSGDVSWKCGGSLITKRFVLTAAHCAVDEKSEAPSVVRLGDVDLASSEDDNFAQQFNIVRFVRHPQHRFSAKYYDIAVVELDQEVNLTVGVCPACIWQESNLPYDLFDVAGFGATGYAEKTSPQLLKAFLKTEDRLNCTQDFEATRGLPNGITEDQLCASNIRMDACQGDSGGPLQLTLYTYNRKIPTLVGVTSFGKSCGFGSFGVYQRVQPYVPWIESIVGESLDALNCAKKYDQYRTGYQLEPVCQVADPYVNRVELHWDQGEQELQCAGTLIDYNTVITSASCTVNPGGKEPTFITILGQSVPITDIARHPQYKPRSLKHNVALIRLKQYLLKNDKVASACPKGGSFDYGLNSLRIVRNITSKKSNKESLFIRPQNQCERSMFFGSNFAKDLDESHSCWSTDNRLIPGTCDIDEGGPLLNRYHTTLHGINILAGSCGPHNPAIILKLDNYRDWIQSFVLDRSTTPEPPIVFREDDSTGLFFKPCNTSAGVEGVCISHWGCASEVEKQRLNRTGVTMCGFEEDVGYICCPRSSIGATALILRPEPVIPLLEISTEAP